MKSLNITDVLLRPRKAGSLVPLTPRQSRQWSWAVDGISSLKMGEASMRIVGSLNIELLKNSIEFVVRRHESLRTRIVLVDGIPRQQIDAACETPLETIDVSGVSSKNVDREVKLLAEEFVLEKISLSAGPLFSAKLLRLSQYEHVLMLGIDHIISDAASCSILRNDIWSTYMQAAQGLPLSLPNMPVQFADYVVWQQDTYSSWREKHESYWWERLTGAQHMELPLDSDLSVENNTVLTMAEFPLGETVSRRLREIAWKERALLPLVVFTIVAVLISQWSGGKNFVIALSSHGRHARPQLVHMIGLLAAPLYLRIEIAGGDTFVDLLGRLMKEFCTALAHQDSGRVSDLIPGCDNTVRFNWVDTNWTQRPDQTLQGGGGGNQVRVHGFPIRKTSHKNVSRSLPTKLSFTVWPSDADCSAGIVMRMEYNTGNFAPRTIEKFGRKLQSYAEDFAERPSALLTCSRLAP